MSNRKITVSDQDDDLLVINRLLKYN